MGCDYFVVPYARRELVEKAIAAVYQVTDRNKFMVVCTDRTDWLKTIPIAVRFVDAGETWRWIAYANGKEIKKPDEAAKLLGVDAAKLAAATGAETFRKLIGFSRYAFDPKSFDAAVDEADGFGEMDAMEKFCDFIAPVKTPSRRDPKR